MIFLFVCWILIIVFIFFIYILFIPFTLRKMIEVMQQNINLFGTIIAKISPIIIPLAMIRLFSKFF